MKAIVSPAESFFRGVSQGYQLLSQKGDSGKFTYFHEFFLNLEICRYFNGIDPEDVWKHIVILRSAWIPQMHRGRGEFINNMELLLDYAIGSKVAVLAVANPFELSDQGKHPEDFARIFVDEIGFRLITDYQQKQLRQRERLTKLGFKPIWLSDIRDRHRVKKEDCLLFVPGGFDPGMRQQIYGIPELSAEQASNVNLPVGS